MKKNKLDPFLMFLFMLNLALSAINEDLGASIAWFCALMVQGRILMNKEDEKHDDF